MKETSIGTLTVKSTKGEQDRLKRYAKEKYGGQIYMADKLGYSEVHVNKMCAGTRNIPDWLKKLVDDYFRRLSDE